MPFPMKSFLSGLLVGAVLLLSGCADPGSLVAKHFGRAAGASVAAALPPPTASVAVSETAVCDLLKALGGPIDPTGVVPKEPLRFIVAFDELGADLKCWSAP